MSSVARLKRTLSGSAEVPATGAVFFLPKQPPSSAAAKIDMPILPMPLVFTTLASHSLRQRFAGNLLHRSHCLGRVGGVEDGSPRHQDFGAGANHIHDIIRA